MTSADLNIHLSEKMTKMTLRTGSLRAVDRRIARPSSFRNFRVRGGVILAPPPTMAKVAETATRARVKGLPSLFGISSLKLIAEVLTFCFSYQYT